MSNNLRKFKRQAEKHNAAGTITVKLESLINSRPALQSLVMQPLPARQAFEVGRAVKAISSELDTYEATRQALCERCANKNEDGSVKMIAATPTEPEHYDIPDLVAFNKELTELVQAEVSLPVKPIKIDTLSGAQLSASALMQLDWLIVE